MGALCRNRSRAVLLKKLKNRLIQNKEKTIMNYKYRVQLNNTVILWKFMTFAIAILTIAVNFHFWVAAQFQFKIHYNKEHKDRRSIIMKIITQIRSIWRRWLWKMIKKQFGSIIFAIFQAVFLNRLAVSRRKWQKELKCKIISQMSKN